MQIVHVEPPSPALQGDQIYRTVQPCAALAGLLAAGGSVVSGPFLHTDVQDLILQADVLVLCQAVDVDLLPLWRARAAAGRANIFEINDNFVALQSFNEAARFYQNPLIRSLTYQLAASAHGLQFSSHGLKERFGHLGPPQRLLMNQLAEPPPPLPPPPSAAVDAPVVLGWGGSLGHREDIAAVLPAIAEIMRRNPQVIWAAMGAKALHPLFAELPQNRVRLHGLGDMAAFGRFVRSLDIGLAPLLDTPFNAGRSDVKYLEYVSAGVVALVQDSPAYRQTVRHGDNGAVFDGPQGLVQSLQALIDAPTQRARLRERAYAEVRASRLEPLHAPARLAWYRECQLRAAAQKTVQPATYSTDKVRGLRKGRYLMATLGAAEQALYAAMLGRSDSQTALRHCRLAIKKDPRAYLPELLRGQIEPSGPAALAACRRALALRPESVNAAYTLATRLLQGGDHAAGAAACHQALEIAPNFAPAHEALAHLSQAQNQPATVRQHLLDAIAANPFYTVPMARLAVLLQDSGELGAAVEVLQRGLRVEPEDWLLRHLMAQTLLMQKKFRPALQQAKRALAGAPDKRPVQALLAKIWLALGELPAARQAAAAAQPSASAQ